MTGLVVVGELHLQRFDKLAGGVVDDVQARADLLVAEGYRDLGGALVELVDGGAFRHQGRAGLEMRGDLLVAEVSGDPLDSGVGLLALKDRGLALQRLDVVDQCLGRGRDLTCGGHRGGGRSGECLALSGSGADEG